MAEETVSILLANIDVMKLLDPLLTSETQDYQAALPIIIQCIRIQIMRTATQKEATVILTD